MTKRSLGLAALLWMAAPTIAGAADDVFVAGIRYPLGPGDDVAVEVVGEQAMSGTFRVRPDGTLDLPYAGAIPVATLTVDAATRAITEHLARTVLKHPQVSLRVVRSTSRSVEVAGGVARPGMYALVDGDVTVRQLLVLAGGLSEASAPRGEIHRDVDGRRFVVEVDLERVYNGDPGADVPVVPGDRLYVPPTAAVYVDGQVARPGAVAYRDGMTLLQAIAQTGSATATARTRGVYILRGSERIPVNMRRIQRGDDPDVPLRPNDRIVVPESPF
jgi:polysaccharide export outer membrane protein